MIRSDVILGGAVTIGGVALLLWVIPNQVAMRPGEFRDPALFPTVCAWLLIGLGLAHFVSRDRAFSWPPLRDLGRLIIILGAMLVAVWAQRYVGYILSSVAMVALLVTMMGERRIHWLVLSILGLPIGVWALFEFIFQHQLP